jgi:trehalose-6-phosphate synthase
VAGDSEVIAEAARIRGESGAAVLLGVDRLDYTKGILQRLLAFEYLLEQHPELRTRVRLIQIAVPSRETVQAYRDLRGHVEDAVQRINRVFGQGGWTPIEYLYGSVDLSTLVSLYRSADVMLVTPLRDGMNLVAKEFVAARTDEDGVLVLSRQAGAAHELQAALLASPQRIDQLAETYFAALMMPRHERRVRMRRLREAITRNDVFDWASRLIDRLGGDAIGAGRSAVARIINDGEGDLPCAGLSFA